MFNITQFFEKFKKIDKNNLARQDYIIESIKTNTGITLTKEVLDIKEETIRLKCSPTFKNEIFLNKEKIENDLRTKNIYLKFV